MVEIEGSGGGSGDGLVVVGIVGIESGGVSAGTDMVASMRKSGICGSRGGKCGGCGGSGRERCRGCEFLRNNITVCKGELPV